MQAEIIKDTKFHTRITTFRLILPRCLDRHILKHRVFSINSQSSRAMSVERVIENISNNPVRYALGYAQNGMTAAPMPQNEQDDVNALIDDHQRNTVEFVRKLQKMNVAKEVANRYLEPFAEVTLIVTATEWDNFFKLRISSHAQKEVRELAEKMKELLETSIPTKSLFHAPFLNDNYDDYNVDDLIMLSAARCARVSYNGKSNANDLELGRRLLEQGHCTPFEHCAVACKGSHANFNGWSSGREYLTK